MLKGRRWDHGEGRGFGSGLLRLHQCAAQDQQVKSREGRQERGTEPGKKEWWRKRREEEEYRGRVLLGPADSPERWATRQTCREEEDRKQMRKVTGQGSAPLEKFPSIP